MKPVVPLLAALLAAALPALPVLAQGNPAPAAVPQPGDPYAALVDVIRQGVDPAAMTEAMLAQMKTAMFTADPGLTAFEKAHPGTIAQVVAAVRPAAMRHSQRLSAQARETIVALLRAKLTVADARAAAEFYGSPLGAKMMRSVGRNLTVRATMKAALSSEGEVTVRALDADNAATTDKVIAELSPAELEEIGRRLTGQGWLERLRALQPEIQAINAELENAPLSPEDEAAISEAVMAVMTKRASEKRPPS